ncbi:MAG: ABC transporter ATP-binding protein/permease [Actinomycetota bacterium]|nr:ABC transporter ATP-binding protein/permease [Actinomycetota bacterium]
MSEDRSTSNKGSLHSLWRMRSYLRPYIGQMTVMGIAALVTVGAELAIPLVSQRVIDGPLADGDSSGLWWLGGLALLLGVLEAVFGFVRRWVQSFCMLDMETAIRNDLYAHLQRLPVAYHDRAQTGQLVTRATSDITTIRRFLGFGLIFLVVNVTLFTVVTIYLLRLYWPLGLLVVLSAVPVAYFTLIFEREYIVASRRCQDLQGDVATVVEEAAVGIRIVKALGRRRTIGGRFLHESRQLRRASLVKVRILAKFWAILDLVPQVLLALVLLIGALAVAAGDLTLGSLVAFVSLVVLLAWPIEALGWILAIGQESATAADRLYEVFDTEPMIADRPGAHDLGAARGLLRFEGVGFRFPGADRDVLHGIDLTVEPGETVAIVGATGSGKTALTALVPRLYDVSSGRITLDGTDIRDVTLTSLRRAVATAFEDPTLFSASARENLTLGRLDATNAEIAEAISVAQADFVYDLPWGLATRIGEQGLSLSGGQRQRLALARAVLGRPSVLVLDDPLSALDIHTEGLVEEALRRVLAATTALVVAHRPSTVLLADRVALLEGGTITAVGTHHELLDRVPAYRQILSAESDSDEVLAGGRR